VSCCLDVCWAGYLEEWLSSICESPSSSPGPSLWRDAALSFYFQLIKSVKFHLYCTEVEDALDLRVRQESQLLEEETDEDVRDACRRARRSSLTSLCSRSLRYSICIGESQAPENDQLDTYIRQLQASKQREVLALAEEGEEEEEEEEDDVISLGIFSDPMLACSLLAEVKETPVHVYCHFSCLCYVYC
jgi:hypothetical protein